MGGVEDHVIALSNELANRGHKVVVISAGGQLAAKLTSDVLQMKLPVHKKNLFTILNCGRQIGDMAKKEKWQAIHAHSRVPAWIAWRAASIASIPFVVTAHSDFSTKTRWIYSPYRAANKTICVSKAVKEGMRECFYENTVVIPNGVDEPKIKWRPNEGPVKFLFVGRLTELKGVQDVLRALPADDPRWRFDIVGDGPYRKRLEEIALERSIDDRVTFHGYSREVDAFLSRASCALFPSRSEGFGLVLARAFQIGTPVLATDIEATVELIGTRSGLLRAGDVNAWEKALADFILNRKSCLNIDISRIPTFTKMVDMTELVYDNLSIAAGPFK